MEKSEFALDFRPLKRSYVEIPHDEKLSITGDLTIEFWLYLREWSGGWVDIISKFADDQNNEFCFRTRDANLGHWYYGDGQIAIKPVEWVPNKDMQLHRWTHIACVRKIGAYGRIFFNGILLREADWSRQRKSIKTSSSIKVMTRAKLDRFQNGKMCELRIWNVARSQEEIQLFQDKHIVKNEKGLVGYWKFNESAGKIIKDSVGNNHGKYIIGEVDQNKLHREKEKLSKKLYLTNATFLGNKKRKYEATGLKKLVNIPSIAELSKATQQHSMTFADYAVNLIFKKNWGKLITQWGKYLTKFAGIPETDWPEEVKSWQVIIDNHQKKDIVKAYVKLSEYLQRLMKDDLAKRVVLQGLFEHPEKNLKYEYIKLAIKENNLFKANQCLELLLSLETNKVPKAVIIEFANACNRNNLLRLKDNLYYKLIDSPYRSTRIIDIFAHLIGKDIYYEDIKTTPINKGKANYGIWLHELEGTRIVEKLTTRQNERVVFRKMACDSGRASNVFPRLYGYIEYRSLNICLMEYFEYAGIIPKFTKKNAEKIALAIIEFENYLDRIQGLDVEILEVAEIKYEINHIISVIHVDYNYKQKLKILYEVLDKFFSEASKKYHEEQLVASHGDLYFSNMSIKSDESGNINDIKMIDFGLCARRPIGYEFHEFIRKSIIDVTNKEFALQLIYKYSEYKSVDAEYIYYNAIAFSIMRSISKTMNLIRKGEAYLKELEAMLDLSRLFLSK